VYMRVAASSPAWLTRSAEDRKARWDSVKAFLGLALSEVARSLWSGGGGGGVVVVVVVVLAPPGVVTVGDSLAAQHEVKERSLRLPWWAEEAAALVVVAVAAAVARRIMCEAVIEVGNWNSRGPWEPVGLRLVCPCREESMVSPLYLGPRF